MVAMDIFVKFSLRLRKLIRHPAVQWGYFLLLLIAIVFVLVRIDWRGLMRVSIDPIWFALAFAAQASYSFLYVETWRWLTEWSGIALPVGETYRVWFQSLAGKYTPGKLGVFAQRMFVYGHHFPVKLAAISGCMVIEWLLSIAGGVLLAVAFLVSGFGIESDSLFYIGLPIVGAMAMVIVLGRFSRRIAGAIAAYFKRPSLFFLSLAAYGVGWILLGMAFFFIVNSIGGDMGLFPCICIFTVAGVTGNIAIFAPAGFGIRDSILFMALCKYLDAEVAFAVMLMSRVVFIATDLFLAGGAFVLGRRKKRTPIDSPHSAAGDSTMD